MISLQVLIHASIATYTRSTSTAMQMTLQKVPQNLLQQHHRTIRLKDCCGALARIFARKARIFLKANTGRNACKHVWTTWQDESSFRDSSMTGPGRMQPPQLRKKPGKVARVIKFVLVTLTGCIALPARPSATHVRGPGPELLPPHILTLNTTNSNNKKKKK